MIAVLIFWLEFFALCFGVGMLLGNHSRRGALVLSLVTAVLFIVEVAIVNAGEARGVRVFGFILGLLSGFPLGWLIIRIQLHRQPPPA